MFLDNTYFICLQGNQIYCRFTDQQIQTKVIFAKGSSLYQGRVKEDNCSKLRVKRTVPIENFLMYKNFEENNFSLW